NSSFAGLLVGAHSRSKRRAPLRSDGCSRLGRERRGDEESKLHFQCMAAGQTQPVLAEPQPARELPETFLSCYEIVNRDALRWGVRLYKVRRDGGRQAQAERGEAKQVIWTLR